MSRISSRVTEGSSLRSNTLCRQSREFAAPPPCHISLQLFSNSGAFKLAGVNYRIDLGGGRIVTDTTANDGTLTVDAVPAGNYLLELPDAGVAVVIAAVSVDVENVPTRVQGYMPCGNDPDDGLDDDSGSDPNAGSHLMVFTGSNRGANHA